MLATQQDVISVWRRCCQVITTIKCSCYVGLEFWTKSNKVAFDNSLCGSNWSLVISWDPWGVHVGTGTMSLAHDVAGAKSSLRWDRSDNFWCRAVCWLIDSDWPSIGWQIVFFVHDINNAESSLQWQNFFYLVLSFWSVDWFRSTKHRLEYCPSLCMISAIISIHY